MKVLIFDRGTSLGTRLELILESSALFHTSLIKRSQTSLDENANWSDESISCHVYVLSDQKTFQSIPSSHKESGKTFYFAEKSLVSSLPGFPLERCLIAEKTNLQIKNDFLGLINSTLVRSGYIGIPAHFILKTGSFPFSIYLKLDNRYIKLSHEGQFPDSDSIKRYQAKGLNQIFVSSEDWKLLLDYMLQENDSSLNSSLSYAYVSYQLLRSCGLDQKVLSSIQTSMRIILDSFSTESLSGLIKSLELKFDESTLYSVNRSFFCLLILKHFVWDSTDARKNLLLASMLADIGLENTQNIGINSIEDLLLLSDADRKDVLAHPMKSVEIMEKINGIPYSAVNIALSHHENHSGTGFPRRIISERIDSMSCILIFARELTESLIKTKRSGLDFNLREYLNNRKEVEKNATNQKIIKVLSDLLEQN